VPCGDATMNSRANRGQAARHRRLVEPLARAVRECGIATRVGHRLERRERIGIVDDMRARDDRGQRLDPRIRFALAERAHEQKDAHPGVAERPQPHDDVVRTHSMDCATALRSWRGA